MDNLTFPGFYIEFAETGTPEIYRINNLSTSGSVQQWRADNNATQGFIGGRASDVSGDIHYAIRITNNSGLALNKFTLRFDGVQFRNSNSGFINNIHVDWQIGEIESIASAENWNAIPALTFEAPVAGDGQSPAVNLDPYHANNRTVIGPVTVDNIVWMPGESLWLRWTDENAPGVDHGVGIDNIRFSAIRTEFNAVNPLEFSATAIGDSKLLLAIRESDSGFFYQLQRSTTLTQWEDMGTPISNEHGPIEWTVDAENNQQFYRVYRYQP